jgi:hypothetical protein
MNIVQKEGINSEWLNAKCRELRFEIEMFGGIDLYAHTSYQYIAKNINTIGDNLLQGVMSNIVPLGENGMKYFLHILSKYQGSFTKMLNLYLETKKAYCDGLIKASTYAELRDLGYKGPEIGVSSPAEDVLEYDSDKAYK